MSIDAEPQPPGQFRWTAAWRRLLPPWRGEALPTLELLDLDRCRERIGRGQQHLRDSGLEVTMAQRYCRIPRYGESRATRLSEIDLEALVGAPEPGLWHSTFTALLTAADMYGEHENVPTPMQFWQLAAAAHGLDFALIGVLEALAGLHANDLPLHAYPVCGFDELRARIAALPDQDYRQLRETLTARAWHGRCACLLAYLFPTELDLVNAAFVEIDTANSGAVPDLLLACRLSAAQAQRLHARLNMLLSPAMWRIALLNLVRCGLPNALQLSIAALAHQHEPARARLVIDIIRAHDSPAALRWLLQNLEQREIRPYADEVARDWPQLALREVAEAYLTQPRPALRDWLQRLAQTQPAAVDACRARCSGALHGMLTELAAACAEAPIEAPMADLPDWLRQPLWHQKARHALVWPQLPAYDVPPVLCWADGERERWSGGYSVAVVQQRLASATWLRRDGLPLDSAILRHLGVLPAAHPRALAGEPLQAQDVDDSGQATPELLLVLPATTALALLQLRDPRRWSEWSVVKLETVIAWLDEQAIELLELLPLRNAEIGLQLALPLASASLATIAARVLRSGGRAAREAAKRWLQRHAELAAAVLLPQLTARGGADDALHALRWLLAQGADGALERGAARHAESGGAALAAVRAFDPLQLAPKRAPALPAFWMPAAWPRPLLRDGRALPLAALDAIGEMLAFSKLEQPYAGLLRLRELCRPASLGSFVWALFEAWEKGSAAGKEVWAFHALAHLGDDVCAARLAQRMRIWPGEGALQRAIAALEVLTAMGSDVALMHLHGFAQKAKSRGLQHKAQAKIDAIAEARGLSAEQLADRLVPDLGLDEHGTLRLDFGTRQFSVGFDEALRPSVRDASGTTLRELPKPGRADDATLAAIASDRYKSLKTTVRALGSQQIARLQLAMCTRRRWSAADWQALIVRHPLLRHLARRLLWAQYVDGQRQGCLRVAEDLTLADASDAPLTLGEGVEIGLVHAIDLSAAEAAAFGQQFADYEILQPFAQLGREVYRLSTQETALSELTRFAGRKVASGSLFGLEAHGGRRDNLDGIWFNTWTRQLQPDFEARLVFSPGCQVNDAQSDPLQTLQSLELRRPRAWGEEARRRWGDLDPLLSSEVLRDVDRMAEVG